MLFVAMSLLPSQFSKYIYFCRVCVCEQKVINLCIQVTHVSVMFKLNQEGLNLKRLLTGSFVCHVFIFRKVNTMKFES